MSDLSAKSEFLIYEAEHGAIKLEVRREGKRDVQRTLDFYNLDAIISVGYRIKSRVATQFRIWATQRLMEREVDGLSGQIIGEATA